MIDEFAKEHLHDHLRWVREALVWKLDGLCEYDIRRPLSATGTNLLGLVEHCAVSGSRYFGEVFARPFPEPLPRWDDEAASGAQFWAAEHETRDEIVGLYRRVWEHWDATIKALAIDAPGYVPWWREDVMLFNIMVNVRCLGTTAAAPSARQRRTESPTPTTSTEALEPVRTVATEIVGRPNNPDNARSAVGSLDFPRLLPGPLPERHHDTPETPNGTRSTSWYAGHASIATAGKPGFRAALTFKFNSVRYSLSPIQLRLL